MASFFSEAIEVKFPDLVTYKCIEISNVKQKDGPRISPMGYDPATRAYVVQRTVLNEKRRPVYAHDVGTLFYRKVQSQETGKDTIDPQQAFVEVNGKTWIDIHRVWNGILEGKGLNEEEKEIFAAICIGGITADPENGFDPKKRSTKGKILLMQPSDKNTVLVDPEKMRVIFADAMMQQCILEDDQRGNDYLTVGHAVLVAKA